MRGSRKDGSLPQPRNKKQKGEWEYIGNCPNNMLKPMIYFCGTWFDLSCNGCSVQTRSTYDFCNDSQGYYCNSCKSWISSDNLIDLTGKSDKEIREIKENNKRL